MNNKPQITSKYKVVKRTINGCPVSIRADTQPNPNADMQVLRHLMAAFEDRIQQEQASQ